MLEKAEEADGGFEVAEARVEKSPEDPTLRVQVPNDRILTQNLYYNYYYPKLKYLIIGYLDPLGYKGGGIRTSGNSSSSAPTPVWALHEGKKV